MKARDYARQNPHKVEQALGKVEGTVSRRTGGKYDTHWARGPAPSARGWASPTRPGQPGHGGAGHSGQRSHADLAGPAAALVGRRGGGSAPAAERDGQGQAGRSPRDGS